MNRIEETESGYLASVALKDGYVMVAFDQIEQTRSHEVHAEVTTWRQIPGVSTEAFSARLNILSLSGRESYRRNLTDAFGKQLQWTNILNVACALLKTAWQARPQSIAIEDAPEKKYDAFLIDPYIVAKGPTVWFGDGGAGKTTIALWLCQQIGKVLYLDYEWDASEIRDRMRQMGGGNGLRYMSGGGVPLADQLPGVRREIMEHGIQYLVVDSAGLACGGEPEKAEMAIRYFNALKALKIPSLTIAHITKSGDDQRPFGSTFWHFVPRLTWNVKGNDETDGQLRVGFFCRKSNVTRRPKPFGVLVEFGDEIGIEGHPLWPEFSDSQPARIRIRELLLSRGKMQRKHIAEELDISDVATRKALQRMPEAASDGRSPYAYWWIQS